MLEDILFSWECSKMASLSVQTPADFSSDNLWVNEILPTSGPTFSGLVRSNTSGVILGLGTQVDTYSEFTFTQNGLTYRYQGEFNITATRGVLGGSVSASGFYNHVEIQAGSSRVASFDGAPISVNFGSQDGSLALGLVGSLLTGAVSLLFGSSSAPLNYENLTLNATPNLPNIAFAGDDTVSGGAGADNLIGHDGNDVILGGAGNDTLIGGLGNDTYQVTEAGDRVIEAAGQGVDTVYSTVDFVLSDNVETLFLTGSATYGAGNALDNTISAVNQGAVDNVLVGGAGNDTLIGGLGNDVFRFEGAGFGRDTITDFGNGFDKIQMQSTQFTSFADVQSHASQVGNDTLIALGQNDQIILQDTLVSNLNASHFLFA